MTGVGLYYDLDQFFGSSRLALGKGMAKSISISAGIEIKDKKKAAR